MSTLQAILTFIGGLVAGYVASFFKLEFDKEKSRFDFKTKILREVWEAVVYCKSLAANLSPQLDMNGIEGETWQQRRDRLLPEFHKAHLEAKRIVRFNAPFYPKALHDLASKVLLESWSEARLFHHGSPENMADYREKSEEKINLINKLAEELCEASRSDVDARMPQWMRLKARSKDSSTINS
jgi:hypothetical protein